MCAYRILVASIDTLPMLGGVSLMTHHLANAFTSHGAEVTVYGHADAKEMEEFPASYRIYSETELERSGRFDVVTGRRGPVVRRNLKRLLKQGRVDRILVSHPYIFGPEALLLGKQLNIPVSAFFYGFELRSQLLTQDSWRARARARARSTPTAREACLMLAKKADEVLAISSYTADLVTGVPRHAPIKITGCGLDERTIKEQFPTSENWGSVERRKQRRQLGLGDAPAIGFVGRLVPSKGVDMLMQVVAKLPDVQIIIVGTGPLELELRALADMLGISSRTVFAGRVTESRKWGYLRSMDVFCLFSRELPTGQVEGFGIVLLEAAAAGCSVAVTRSGGMIDVVESGKTGLMFPPDAIEDAAKDIHQLLNSPALEKTLVRAARAQILDKYNWRSIARGLLEGWGLRDINTASRDVSKSNPEYPTRRT